MTLTTDEDEILLSNHPRPDDMLLSLAGVSFLPRKLYAETRKVIALARKFNQEVVRPSVLELERRMMSDPDYLPWDFVRTANHWGLFSLWIPKIFGGEGYSPTTLSCFLEEIASVCLGMANLIGVHYLGIGALMASFNMPLIIKILGEVTKASRTETPCLISLAVTEPNAGTDAEETELMDKGEMSCTAQRANGGYRLNGTKVFISNGHLSTWHIVTAFRDPSRPSETAVTLALKTGVKGFSFGRKERKMGQKACPASELIFSDCFVPDSYVCIDKMQVQGINLGSKKITQRIIDFVVSTSRAGVGAFGAGVARGAYEKVLGYAENTKRYGQRLIDQEWAQCLLAEMYKNFSLARLSYMESNYANSVYGGLKYVMNRPAYAMNTALPGPVIRGLFRPFISTSAATKSARKQNLENYSEESQLLASGWGSLTKVAATDLGMRNCHLACEFMGEDGIRLDRGAEKLLRDAKLLQIYEGTNQLNRLNIFKCLVARGVSSGVTLFDE